MIEFHTLLEGFNQHPMGDVLSRLTRISKSLDPLLEYPQVIVHNEYTTPLGHMVSMLQDYFHGADDGDDAYLRNQLFAMVGEMLERNGNVERDLAWVIPRILNPLMRKNGWTALINPAGTDYAIGVGRTLAPLLPQVLCEDIMTEGADALIAFSPRGKSCDAAWHVLEMVAPAYLDLIVHGALPKISERSLEREVSSPGQELPRHSPRL